MDNKRRYTLSGAVLDQRRAAAQRPRGGTREWKSVRVSAGVVAAIDARRGGRSRNDYLAGLLRVNDGRP